MKYLRRFTGSSLLINAGSMIGTTVVTAGLGFVYWWLAARQFSQEAVGFASALIAAMGLLGSVGMLGLGTLLMGELPRRPGQRGALISTALIVSGLGAALLGLLFTLVAPFVSAELKPLTGNGGAGLLFTLGVALNAIGLVFDQGLIGLLRGGLQLWRNTLFAVIKLVLLLLLGLWAAGSAGMGIYTTWTAGNLISLGVVGLLAARGIHLKALKPRWTLLRELPGAALWHHTLNLALQTPGLVLPMIVTAMCSSALNASFSMSWLTLHLVFAIPYALTTVLYAAGAADQTAFANKARLTLGLASALGLLSNIVVWLGAEFILGIFGRIYAEQAAWPLRIMALGVFPLIIKDHFVAIYRVNGRIARAALIAILGSALELGAAAYGTYIGGLNGLSIGLVIAFAGEAVFLAWPVFSVVSRSSAHTDKAMPLKG